MYVLTVIFEKKTLLVSDYAKAYCISSNRCSAKIGMNWLLFFFFFFGAFIRRNSFHFLQLVGSAMSCAAIKRLWSGSLVQEKKLAVFLPIPYFF